MGARIRVRLGRARRRVGRDRHRAMSLILTPVSYHYIHFIHQVAHHKGYFRQVSSKGNEKSLMHNFQKVCDVAFKDATRPSMFAVCFMLRN